MASEPPPPYSHFLPTPPKPESNKLFNYKRLIPTDAMKLALILLVLCSAVVVFTAEEVNGIFRLPHLLNPRQASENVSAAIGACLSGDYGPGCPYVNSNILACYYPRISDPRDKAEAAEFQTCLCNPKPRKLSVPAFQPALDDCLTCLQNNTLSPSTGTQIQSVYTNFCAADPEKVDIGAFLEEEPVLLELQDSWGFVSFYTDTKGVNIISESGVTMGTRGSLYEGPTSTIDASTTSSTTMSAGASVTTEATATATATATETGKEGGAVGGMRVDGVVAGVVGLVGLVLGAVG